MVHTTTERDKMSENIDAIKAGAVLMYEALNRIYTLHDVEPLESESNGTLDGCLHCSNLAQAIIEYPCPTVQILLANMVPDETTSDDEAEKSEPTPAA